MPSKNPDLHGSVPDRSPVALVLVDVINDFDFPEAEELLAPALAAARKIAALKRRARAAGIPVIYANDNFGRWKSDFRRLVAHCLEFRCRGRAITELLRPSEDDYFVLKPKHSAFFHTQLELLLSYLGATTLVIAGFATNYCILFTANDAFMRDFEVIVPPDCVAAESGQENAAALEQIETVAKARLTPSEEIDFAANRGSGADLPI